MGSAALAGARQGIQGQIQARVRANLAELDRQLEGQPIVRRLAVEGGWYAVLRIAALEPDEVTVRRLLDEGVWVHPGVLFRDGELGVAGG